MSMFLRSIGKANILVQVALVAVALLIMSSPVAAGTGSTSSTTTTASDSQGQNQPNVICPNGQCFTDVLPSNNFFDYINRIYQDGIVSGYACGGLNEPCDAQHRPYYRPNKNVNRQSMAKFIDNARHLPEIQIEGASTGNLIYARNSSSGTGVFGFAPNGTGVAGSSATGDGVQGYGTGPGGYAGHFLNDVFVTGHITATGGCCAGPVLITRIDDPLDPANKYLSESAVQSPDLTTVINGNAGLDGKGEATVALPTWFEAANRDFRYSLTAVGAPGPNLYIAQELSGNQFKIAGGAANGKVSWQVTGIRQDPYANAHPVAVEQDKPANERGKYQNPIEYGQPASLGPDYELQQKMKQRLEQGMQQGSESKP
jgi:hypothetical protein